MVDLIGPRARMRIDLASWHFALELARDAGWRFMGTLPPEGWEGESGPPGELTQWPDLAQSAPDVWGANYVTCQGQRVTDEDARALAEALERALPDVPDHDAREHKPEAIPMPRDMALLLRDLDDDLPDFGQQLNAVEWFSGARKSELRRLIGFCRRGQFRIE